MICIIIVGDIVISLIDYIYIIYYTSYLDCKLYKANRRDLRGRQKIRDVERQKRGLDLRDVQRDSPREKVDISRKYK